MFKKVHVLAFLALFFLFFFTSSSAPVNEETEKAMKAKFMSMVKAQLKKRFSTRESNNECGVITCAKEGESCDIDSTVCQLSTTCHNNTCSLFSEGDTCDSDSTFGCFNDFLYCDETTGTCNAYNREGDKCDGKCLTEDDTLYCSILEGTCKLNPQKVGDPCEKNIPCPPGSYCNATEETPAGVCEAYPGVPGADCSKTLECDETKWLYCSDDTHTCVELPKENEECISDKCNEGLYCDDNNTCKAFKGYGEKCEDDKECKEGLVCAGINGCVKRFQKEGEYCDETETIFCENFAELTCKNNICVKKDGTCEGIQMSCKEK